MLTGSAIPLQNFYAWTTESDDISLQVALPEYTTDITQTYGIVCEALNYSVVNVALVPEIPNPIYGLAVTLEDAFV